MLNRINFNFESLLVEFIFHKLNFIFQFNYIILLITQKY
jgi:hypothetical protein